MKSFFSFKKHKRLLKSKKQWSLCMCRFTLKNLINFNYYQFPCIFLFLLYLKNFPPGGKINTDPSGSGSTALEYIVQAFGFRLIGGNLALAVPLTGDI